MLEICLVISLVLVVLYLIYLVAENMVALKV